MHTTQPHRMTTLLANAAERKKGLEPHQRARLAWLAWVHFSSRSGASIAHLYA